MKESVKKVNTFVRNYNAYLLLLFYCSIAALMIRFENNLSLQYLLTKGTELRGSISQGLSTVHRFIHLEKENEKLVLQNSLLLAHVIERKNAQRDSTNLGRMALFMENSPIGFIPARVVERRFNTRENVLLIDAGSQQGVEVNMSVLTPDGLVGRVVRVSENYAKVMPVIHPEFSVGVVSDSNNTGGLLRWDGEEEQVLHMQYVPTSSTIFEGEEISTAEFSSFALRGVPVGKIIEVVPEKKFFRIRVKAAVDFSALTYVLVAPGKHSPEKEELMQDSIDDR